MENCITIPTKEELTNLFDKFDYNHDGVLSVDTELFSLVKYQAEKHGIDINSEVFKDDWNEIQKVFAKENHAITQDYFVNTTLEQMPHNVPHCPSLVDNSHLAI